MFAPKFVGGVLLVAITFTCWCPGGIAVTSRDSSLAASGRITGDEFILSDQSSELGLYDESIGDSLIVPGGGGTTSANASQRSEVASIDDADGFANGGASAQVAEFDAIAAQALSQFFLRFEVTGGPETLTIQGNFQSTLDAATRVTLSREPLDILFEELTDGDEGGPLSFSRSFALEPGTYALAAEASANGTPTLNSATFELTFSTQPIAVIPLPPALLGGAAMLVLAALKARRVSTF